MKVVVDTNVLISAVYSPNGNPSKILQLIFSDDKMLLFYNQKILDEYKRVLSYKKFKFSIEKQKVAIENIKDYGDIIEPKPSKINMPDESDRIFYDTAKESGAILITGNKKHYPNESFILTPAEFSEKFT